MSKNVQVCFTISQELNSSILKIASQESRTLSQTVSLLLMKAIKEKTRKRGKKENNIQHNTPN